MTDQAAEPRHPGWDFAQSLADRARELNERVAALMPSYEDRRAEVLEMIEEGDQQDDHAMSPDGLADALMEIADGWTKQALQTVATARASAGPLAECGCGGGSHSKRIHDGNSIAGSGTRASVGPGLDETTLKAALYAYREEYGYIDIGDYGDWDQLAADLVELSRRPA